MPPGRDWDAHEVAGLAFAAEILGVGAPELPFDTWLVVDVPDDVGVDTDRDDEFGQISWLVHWT